MKSYLQRKHLLIGAIALGSGIAQPSRADTPDALESAAAASSQGNLVWTRTNLNLTTSGAAIGVAVSPSGALFAADGFDIKRSLDRGATWTTVSPFASFPGGAIAIDPSDPNVIVSGRSHGLLKSVDGGTNWFHLTDLNAGPAVGSIAFAADSSLTMYAGVGAGWGLYKTVNGGATWSNPLSSRDVHSVATDPLNSQILYVGTYNYSGNQGGVLKSTDGGTTWSSVFQNPKVNTVTVDPLTPSLLYATTEDDGIFKSLDGGATWSAITGTGIVAPVAALLPFPGDGSLLYDATRGQGVFFSTDRGNSWSAANTGLTDLNIAAMAIQSQSPNTLFVATYGGQGFWAVVPEPSTGAILATGVIALLAFRQRSWCEGRVRNGLHSRVPTGKEIRSMGQDESSSNS